MSRWPSKRKEAALMTGRSRFLLAALAAPILALQPLAYQAPAKSTLISSKGAQELARGWLALVNGQPADAERSSDALLKVSPRDHDALSLKIRASLAGRGVPAALDAYEAWLPAVRQREDLFLLETIATGLVEMLTASKDMTIRARALELLAAIGHAEAAAQLRTLAGTGATAQSDAALARLGDAAAVKRLATRVRDGGARDVSDAIDALSEGDVKTAAPTIAAALDPSRPLPTKMAAARALGRLGDPTLVPQLKQALKDPDPPVRVMAAAALARLGDDSSAELMRGYANSPVGDLRLIAVEGSAPGDPTGPWVAIATGVLNDPDPLVRLRAAELLLRHAANPGSARDVFAQALSDTNPAMRYAAAERLDRLPGAALEQDIPSLRRLLRDSLPEVQIEAAAGILRVAGAVP
jgi:HEAT repeat protein